MTKAVSYCLIGVVLGIVVGALMAVPSVSAGGFGNSGDADIVVYDASDFFDAFNDHIYWNAVYMRYEDSSYVSGNDYVDVIKEWNEDLQGWKFSIIFDIPVDVYSVLFMFECDKIVKDYAIRTGEYEYTIVYDDYTAVFNWSDMANIPNLNYDHGTLLDRYYFSFQRFNVPSGYYVFDPWFGSQTNPTTFEYLRDVIVYQPVYFNSTCTYPYAQNITASIRSYSQCGTNITCGIYDNTTKTLIGQTEILFVDGNADYEWWTFDFDIPVNITSYKNTTLALVCWSDNPCTGSVGLGCFVNSSNRIYKDDEVFDGTLPNTVTLTLLDAGYESSIYCNYTCICNDVNDTTPVNTTDVDCDYIGLCPSTIVFILWMFIVWSLIKIPRSYIGVPLVLGLSQFVLAMFSVVGSISVFGDISLSILVASFGFMFLGFYKTYKGLDI